MKLKLNTLHLSTLDLWPMGKNKGRVSIYLPLENFVNRGHEVLYLTNKNTQPSGTINGIVIQQIWCPVNPINIKGLSSFSNLVLYPLTFLFFFIAGFKFAKKRRPDVIYAHTKETALAAYLLAKIFKAKYVLRLYGINEAKGKSIFHKIAKLDLYIAIKLKADLYILTNDGTDAKNFAIRNGVSYKKIHFLKNGIDKSWSKKRIEYSKLDLIGIDDVSVLLTASRLTAWKQVDLIIKSMPEIIKIKSNIRLVIIGDGLEKNRLEELSKELNIEQYVIFVGGLEQNDVFNYMSIADVFISMNALSSMTNPVFEAMICGKTVIALNKGNTEELITDDITGLLLQPNEIDKLPSRVIDILRDDSKRTRIGLNAKRKLIEEWPTWKERVDYEVDIIEDLCG